MAISKQTHLFAVVSIRARPETSKTSSISNNRRHVYKTKETDCNTFIFHWNMLYLIYLDVAKETDDVHHGRVKLETQIRRTNVIADAEESLKYQSKSHRLKRRNSKGKITVFVQRVIILVRGLLIQQNTSHITTIHVT